MIYLMFYAMTKDLLCKKCAIQLLQFYGYMNSHKILYFCFRVWISKIYRGMSKYCKCQVFVRNDNMAVSEQSRPKIWPRTGPERTETVGKRCLKSKSTRANTSRNALTAPNLPPYTNYGPEGQGFESLRACQKQAWNLGFKPVSFCVFGTLTQAVTHTGARRGDYRTAPERKRSTALAACFCMEVVTWA